MKVSTTALEGVLLIEPRVFGDDRGFLFESYSRRKFEDHGIDVTFVQDNHSKSRKGVLRGLHYQENNGQAKLGRVTQGEVFDVGFAHGFCVLSDAAELLYKCSDYYLPEDERGIIWNDPDIGIEWPIDDPILSEKDKKYPRLKDI